LTWNKTFLEVKIINLNYSQLINTNGPVSIAVSVLSISAKTAIIGDCESLEVLDLF
jgi:hypothetical protein